MTDIDFWALIGTVPVHNLSNDLGATANDADIEALGAVLAKLPDSEAIAFFRMFSEKLHALDTPAHYNACRVGGNEASSDVFLYARCHLLSLGPEQYDAVLNTPAQFPPDLWFEDVLSLANETYDRVWENDPDPDSHPSYESFSNALWSTT
ncbi:MAG: DUF4240 domain-containing protein [Silicimonas sp.]|nr:DUF4240 domain-containing protein [Silicimonas sp.]